MKLEEGKNLVQIKLIFLGTSSSIPTCDRNLTSLALLRGKEILLFDVGEGTQRQIIKANIGFNKITKIFITHLHGDHLLGVLGLLQTMSLYKRTESLNIYGPRGIIGFIKHNIKYLKFRLTYNININQIKSGLVLEEKEYCIKALKSEHSVQSYAYTLEEYDRPGPFFPEKAVELGIPKGKLWSDLQQGKSIDVEHKKINPNQVLGPKRSGRKIGISGDTRPILRLLKFFSKSDIIIFDSTYGKEYTDKAKENMHSTCVEAAQMAKKAQAKLLILTHFSARYRDVTDLISQALEVHPKVLAASDFNIIEVPYSNSG